MTLHPNSSQTNIHKVQKQFKLSIRLPNKQTLRVALYPIPLPHLL